MQSDSYPAERGNLSEISYERAAGHIAVLRAMIQHEDTLQNHRLSWMWTLQGLLLATASVAWNVGLLPVVLIAGIGFSSCLSIGYSLDRSVRAIKALLGLAREFRGRLPAEFNIPPTIGARRPAIEWLMPGRFLPWLFGLAWVLVVILRLTDSWVS